MKTTIKAKLRLDCGLIIIDDVEDGSRILLTMREAEDLIEQLQKILEEQE